MKTELKNKFGSTRIIQIALVSSIAVFCCITDANGREASLVPTLLNVQATNGVVHVIDRVILPDLSK